MSEEQDMTAQEAFNLEFGMGDEDTPELDEDNLQEGDSVDSPEIKDPEINTGGEDDQYEPDIFDEIENEGVAQDQEDDTQETDYKALYEQSLTKQEELEAAVETANKRMSDTHRDWQEMNARLKTLEETGQSSDDEDDDYGDDVHQDRESTRLDEELPEYSEVITESMEQIAEKKYQEFMAKREAENKAKQNKLAQAEAAHVNALEDPNFGHPDYFEVCNSSEFDAWTKQPEARKLLQQLASEQSQDRLSNRALQMKIGIMNRFKRENGMRKAIQQRKEANTRHQKEVLDMTTQVPKKTGRIPQADRSLTDFDEAEAAFLAVFEQ